MRFSLVLLTLLCTVSVSTQAQTGSARLSGTLVETTTGPYAAGDPYEVLVLLSASPGTAGLGTSTIVLDFDAAALSFAAQPLEGQDYAFLNYSQEQRGYQGEPAYYASLVRRTNAARLTVAVIMGYGTDDRGQALTETPTEVVRLRFTVVDPGRSPALAFSNVQAFTGPGEAYSLGAFEGLDAVPPVALASFEAAQSEGNVVLRWETLRESNNAAFVVERVVEYAGVMPAGIEALEGESAEAFTPITQVEGGGTRAEATQYVYTDTTLPFTARTARYRLRQVSVDGSATLAGVVEVAVGVPETFAVHPAFPNPVQGEATLRYELPEDGPVEIVVYDLLGRRVQVLLDEEQEAGRYEVRLDTRSLASGVYLYRVRAERERAVQKITVMR